MKKQLSVSLLLLVISISFSACPRTPDGLTFGSPTRNERIGFSKTTFFLEVQDENGRSIPGVSITAKSIRDQDQDISDIKGQASVTLTLQSDDSLEFFFLSKSPSIDWSRAVSTIPQGQKEITYVFKADSFGSVRLVEVSY